MLGRSKKETRRVRRYEDWRHYPGELVSDKATNAVSDGHHYLEIAEVVREVEVDLRRRLLQLGGDR